MFTFDADPRAIIEERFAQFAALGTPAETIREVSARLDDFWRDGPADGRTSGRAPPKAPRREAIG